MKRVLKIVLFCLCFIAAERFAHRQTHGFQVCKIYSNLPYAPQRDLLNSEEDQKTALSLLQQKFTYLACGCECYVFLSDDNSTVLKLFKHQHMNPDHWVQKIPLPKKLSDLRCKLYRNPKEKQRTFFNSCVIAHRELKEEVGLIFSHLVKTENLDQTITLIDPLHIEHKIPADKVEFVLQKMGTAPYSHLETLISNGELDRGQKSIDSLISLIEIKIAKQIYDRDPVLKRNFAFVDDQAIEIDLGSFSQENEHINLKLELLELSQLQSWLQERDPALAGYLESKMATLTSF